MFNFMVHGAECAFWCFVWHQFHHWWAHKHEAHYEPKPEPEIVGACVCSPGEIWYLGSPDPCCPAVVHKASAYSSRD